MHCKGLAKMSPKSKYWYSAILHLVKSHFNGQGCHHLISKQLKSQTPDFSGFWKPWMQTLPVDARNLDSEPDQCQSASEFLLEPWVLLQLPFQPSLLHQWAVAVLAEALKLQKDTISIFIIGVPRELWEEAQLLKKLIETLMEGALTLLSIFCNFANGAQQNICQRLRKVRTKLFDTISRVSPIIEFILSDRCKNVISGIKRASWGSIHNRKEQNLLPVDKSDDFGLCPIWYNSMFWIASKLPKKLVSDGKFPDVSNMLHTCIDSHFSHKDDLADYYREMAQENIIKTGILVGASVQDIADVATRVQRLRPFPWSRLFKYTIENGILDENLSGVTYNIMNLHYDLKTEREAAETARTVIYLLGTEEFGCKRVLYKEGCQKGYKFSASTNLKYTLNKVLANKDWTYEKVLERTRNTLSNVVVEKEAPTLKFGAEKVAGIFQARIKNLVFNMLKQQFQTSASGSHPMLWYPECATVQYLLPCFVANFLDMYKDPSATRIQLKNFILLVHELLYSYEQNPYVQNFTEQWKISYLYERRRTLYYDIHLSVSAFLVCMEEKFDGTKILPVLVESFKNLLITKLHVQNVDGDSMLFDWSVQMFMLFTRLKMCMLTLGWYKEQLSRYFFQVWIGCGFTISKEKGSEFQMCRITLDTTDGKYNGVFRKDQSVLFAIFVALKKSKRLGVDKFNLLQGPCFSLDLKSKVFFAVHTGDYWKLRQLMAPLLCDAGLLVPLSKVCENNSPMLKEPYISNEPLEGVKYVKMTQPGEVTLYPVKHCRWCGLLTADEVYRVCPLCLEYPEYNDTNHFCSEKCEKEALDKQHREEHARYFMVKLNMDSEMK